MKELFKKKGYELIVRSWENDADNYKKETMQFDNLDEAKFVYELCLKFGSYNSNINFNPEKLGNVQFFRDGHHELYEKAIEKHITKLSKKYIVPDDYHDAEYVDECLVYELIGYWDDGQKTRVVDSVKLIYYPEDIYVEVIQTS